jgi:Na+-driven multidrug efflux pump
VIAVGADFLHIISWNFLAQGIVFTCSGIFQGLGNTKPALMSSFLRIALFAPLAILLAGRPGFTLDQVWYLSVATVLLQAVFSYSLLHRQFRLRLGAATAAAAMPEVLAEVLPEPMPEPAPVPASADSRAAD